MLNLRVLSMRILHWCCVMYLMGTALLSAADPYCPAYPLSMRTEIEQSIDLDRQFQEYVRYARTRKAAVNLGALGSSGNFIDQAIAKKLSADNVEPAPRTSDTEF